MKNYTITVNGNVYNVTVEEGTTAGVVQTAAPVVAQAAPAVAPAAPVQAAPAVAPAAPAAPAPKVSGAAGSVRVEAGAAGKVFSIAANVGQSVKKGEPVVVIEAMKMEIPVVAPEDGTVASIDVAVGDAIEAGALLATLN